MKEKTSFTSFFVSFYDIIIIVGEYMKKLFLLFLAFFPLIVKADLIKTQEDAISFYTTNFIEEGNKRIDSNGYSLLAYINGENRILGYQNKLSKSDYTNEYKWGFDDASFVSYMYLKTFNLILTNTNTSKKDNYSGLNLKSLQGNPYQLSDFLDDALNSEHFYVYKENANISDEDINLKAGDLIFILEIIIMLMLQKMPLKKKGWVWKLPLFLLNGKI